MSNTEQTTSIAVHQAPAELARIESTVAFYKSKKDVIRAQVAPNASDAQLEVLFNQAARYGLDPMAKEVWCVNMGNGITIFAGRDGFLKLAQQNPDFDGIISETVCTSDHFAMDPVNQKIEHRFSNKESRGPIIGAYCVVHHKKRRPTIVYVDIDEYRKTSGPWKSHPSAMIKKVAEVNALKRAFGLAAFEYSDDMEEPPYHIAEARAVVEDVDLTEMIEKEQAARKAAAPAATEEPESDHQGKFFAIAQELELPPFTAGNSDTDGSYYIYIGKVLGRDLDTVRGITDPEWEKLAKYIGFIKSGHHKMPSILTEAKEKYLAEQSRVDHETGEIQEAEYTEEETTTSACVADTESSSEPERAAVPETSAAAPSAPAKEEDPFADEVSYRSEFEKYSRQANRPSFTLAPGEWRLVVAKVVGKDAPKDLSQLQEVHYRSLAQDAAEVASGVKPEHEALRVWKEANQPELIS